jgi:hypothetical protein
LEHNTDSQGDQAMSGICGIVNFDGAPVDLEKQRGL